MKKLTNLVFNIVSSTTVVAAIIYFAALYVLGFFIPFCCPIYTITDLSFKIQNILLNPFMFLISLIVVIIYAFYCGKASAKEEVETMKKSANDEIDQNIRTVTQILEINKTMFKEESEIVAKRMIDKIKAEKGL